MSKRQTTQKTPTKKRAGNARFRVCPVCASGIPFIYAPVLSSCAGETPSHTLASARLPCRMKLWRHVPETFGVRISLSRVVTEYKVVRARRPPSLEDASVKSVRDFLAEVYYSDQDDDRNPWERADGDQAGEHEILEDGQ